jgi:hypothetical protein
MEENMPLEFYGTFEQLHGTLTKMGVHGTWAPEPNGVYMLRCECGANLHWASGTKRIWIDGPPGAVEHLKTQLQANLLPDP